MGVFIKSNLNQILLLETYIQEGNLVQANLLLLDLKQNMENFDEILGDAFSNG